MPHLLYVEDHPLYRAGFADMAARAFPQLSFQIASSAEEAIAVLDEGTECDLVVADRRLPGMDGVALLEHVGRRWPTVARVLLCGEPTRGLAHHAQSQGFLGCLSKLRDCPSLMEALGRILSGDTIYDADPPMLSTGISEKRRHILELAACGRSNKMIGRSLGITERTVKDHWKHIFHNLEAANRAEAVREAYRRRLI